MKKGLITLVLCVVLFGGCTTTSLKPQATAPPLPPLPPGAALSTTASTASAVRLKTTRTAPKVMAAEAVALAGPPAPTGNVLCERSQTMLVEVDDTGLAVASAAPTTVLKFTAVNPTKGRFTVSTSEDLTAWQVLYSSTNNDPVIVYDFSHAWRSKFFYRFVVDAVQ